MEFVVGMKKMNTSRDGRLYPKAKGLYRGLYPKMRSN